MLVRGCAAMLTAIALTLLVGPLPAEAHASLVASDPADASTLDALPQQLSLTFDEPVDEPAFVSVTAPDGSTVASGEAEVFDATVSQPLAAAATAAAAEGTYTVAYRVRSLDGHPVTDTLSFNVGRASQPATATVEPAGPEQSAGNSFISEHVASLTIAMVAVTVAICLAILKAGRNRQQTVGESHKPPSSDV